MPIEIGERLTIADVVRVAREGAEAALSHFARARVERARSVVERLVQEGQVIYGITTGVGELAGVRISSEQTAQLQVNIVRSRETFPSPDKSFRRVVESNLGEASMREQRSLATWPVPPFFRREKVGQIWQVPYAQRAAEARAWAQEHSIRPAQTDATRICLMCVDVQNTFCIPGFELFVAGRSGNAAVEDNVRLCEFIYRHVGVITQIFTTMDTHTAMQIFHPVFWINDAGNHPEPYTQISVEDVVSGRWKVNPAVAHTVGARDDAWLQGHAQHYVRRLAETGKYLLTVWPYHAMLGGIGHALVPAVEEAVFFHSIARYLQSGFETKGSNPLTEHYSVLGPEVLAGTDGTAIGQKNFQFIQKLLNFDLVIIAGQAKSHCVAWTIDDLLSEVQATDPALAGKVYLLEDCTSPVVVPGVVDFTAQADAAFKRFQDAKMHIVRSTDPIGRWPGVHLAPVPGRG